MEKDFSFLAHLQILPEWEAVAQRFLELGGTVMVLGAMDTGKSTLSRYLVHRAYVAGQPAGLVDLDLGQSHLGPPACLGLGRFPPLVRGDDVLFPQGLYFIGQTSPLGAILEVAVGCRVLADQALSGGLQHLVVNTSGLVQGPGALRLKKAQVELLQPGLILALQQERELEPLLRGLGEITAAPKTPPPFMARAWGEGEAPDVATPTPTLTQPGEGRKMPEEGAQADKGPPGRVGLKEYPQNSIWQILRLPVSSRVSRRDPETRRFYREVRFRRYFQQAGELRLPWSSFTWEGLPLGQGWPLPPWRLQQLGQRLGVRVLSGVGQGRRAVLLTEATLPSPAAAEPAGWPDGDQVHWLSWEGLQWRLVGLLDGRYRTLALGLILPGPWDRDALALLTPLAPAATTQVRQVKLGKLRLNREGQELPQG